MRTSIFTPEMDEKMRALFAANKTAAEIAEALGMDTKCVQNRLYRLGLRRRASANPMRKLWNEANVKPVFVSVVKTSSGTVSRSAIALTWDGNEYHLGHFEREQTDEYTLDAWIDRSLGSRMKVVMWRMLPETPDAEV